MRKNMSFCALLMVSQSAILIADKMLLSTIGQRWNIQAGAAGFARIKQRVSKLAYLFTRMRVQPDAPPTRLLAAVRQESGVRRRTRSASRASVAAVTGAPRSASIRRACAIAASTRLERPSSRRDCVVSCRADSMERSDAGVGSPRTPASTAAARNAARRSRSSPASEAVAPAFSRAKVIRRHQRASGRSIGVARRGRRASPRPAKRARPRSITPRTSVIAAG